MITHTKGLSFTFFIHIRNNTLVRKAGLRSEVHAKGLFNCSYFRSLRNQRVLFGHRLYIGDVKTGKNEWLIIIGDTPVKHTDKYYGER